MKKTNNLLQRSLCFLMACSLMGVASAGAEPPKKKARISDSSLSSQVPAAAELPLPSKTVNPYFYKKMCAATKSTVPPNAQKCFARIAVCGDDRGEIRVKSAYFKKDISSGENALYLEIPTLDLARLGYAMGKGNAQLILINRSDKESWLFLQSRVVPRWRWGTIDTTTVDFSHPSYPRGYFRATGVAALTDLKHKPVSNFIKITSDYFDISEEKPLASVHPITSNLRNKVLLPSYFVLELKK